MKLATWNVNSLAVRLPQLIDWLGAQRPDVMVLQETKIVDDKWPQAEIEAAGYRAVWLPEVRDVFDPVAWAGQIHCTPEEREHFRQLVALGLADGFPLFEQSRAGVGDAGRRLSARLSRRAPTPESCA